MYGLEISRLFFMKKNIGIQGIKGSFHHIVANNYFEVDINLVEYLSFEELILNLNRTSSACYFSTINNFKSQFITNFQG